MSSDLDTLTGKSILAIYHDDYRIVFRYGINDYLEMHAYGDCCSKSWIESVDIIPGALGATITSIFDDKISEQDRVDEVVQFYKTIIRTTHGDIIIDYRNSSNGYYGGSLEKKNFNYDALPRLFASIDPAMLLKELI